MDDLLSDFLSETAEHIQGIESQLVLFERNSSDTDAVMQIFRLLHTIKGTCGFLGLSRLQAISHAAETLIDTLRNGAPPAAIAVSLLLQAMDRIKHLVARVGELGEEPAGSDADIADRIGAYLRGESGGETDVAHPGPASPAGPKPRVRKPKRSKAPEPTPETTQPAAAPELTFQPCAPLVHAGCRLVVGVGDDSAGCHGRGTGSRCEWIR